MDEEMGTLMNAYSQNLGLKTTTMNSFVKSATLCSSNVVELKNTGLGVIKKCKSLPLCLIPV